MNALAGLMNPAAIGQSVFGAFEQGREQGRQRAAQSALAAYAANPSAETAASIAQHDPMMGIQLGQVERGREMENAKLTREANTRRLTAEAAQGSPTALVSLWSEDPEMAMKLDDRQAERLLEGYEFIANAAYDISERPPEERAAAWDSYVDQAIVAGYDGLAQFKGNYSDQTLNAVIAKAGQMKEFKAFQRPDYQPLGFDQEFVNTRDPEAMAEIARRRSGGGAPPAKTVGGTSYYQNPETGQWFDNPEEAMGGGVSNGTGGF